MSAETRPDWFTMDNALLLLNLAEKRGEWEKSFRSYGKDGRVFTVRVMRKKDFMEVYIDNAFIKECKNDGEVLAELVKKAEEF